MYIVGIDPGIRRCGYAIISQDKQIIDAGVLINEKKNSESYSEYLINDQKIIDEKKVDRRMRFSRMYDTYQNIISLLEPHREQISVIGLEQFYFMTRTQQHAEFLYGLRGALVMYAITQGRSVYDVGPTEMKRYITGRGGAKKSNIHTMIMSLYNLTQRPKYADISDALGIAYVTQALSKQH